jgi:hypothetical protein
MVQGLGFRAQDVRVQGSWFGVWSVGFTAQGSGFRVHGSGVMLQGLWFGV